MDASGNASLHDDRPQDTRRSRRARRAAEATSPVDVTVVVIGAGQAGLSAAYHLRRAGLVAVGERGWERGGGDVRRARRQRRRPVARGSTGGPA